MCKILTLLTSLSEEQLLTVSEEYNVDVDCWMLYPDREGSSFTYTVQISGINNHCLCTIVNEEKKQFYDFIEKLLPN